MRRFLRWLLSKPVSWLANRYSSKPNLQRVQDALSELYAHTLQKPGDKGLVLALTDTDARFIIFSDQHKGAKDGSDDFMLAEPTYLLALGYYLQQGHHLISLGDEEELWENLLGAVKQANGSSIALQKEFIKQGRFTKVFGNHDLFWNNDPFAGMQLKSMYGQEVKVYEAVLLRLDCAGEQLPIFLTHGHQGDGQSDGNKFSAWFVGRVWAPLQSYLRLNLNTPAYSKALKTAHNVFMYQWSQQEQHPVLVTGHTHQPVFASLTHLERLYMRLHAAELANDAAGIAAIREAIHFKKQTYDYVQTNYHALQPCYFNSGCCCYNDGDITGIEIADGMIRLVLWKRPPNKQQRIVLEEMSLRDLL